MHFESRKAFLIVSELILILDENSEFSVPSTRMFSSIKLSMSNASDGHWRCVYSSILLDVSVP